MSDFFNEQKARSKNPLKPKAPFKWVFMDIILSTAPKSLKSDTTFSNYLLIFHASFKIPNLYIIKKISTEEVMYNPDMLQSRFVKNKRICMVRFRNNFSRCMITTYLDGVQRRMPNLRSLFDISISRTSGKERTSQSDMENAAYNCTLS